MNQQPKFDEMIYIRDLAAKIAKTYPNYKVIPEKQYGRFAPDLTIESNKGLIIIEVKNAQKYSSLPFSTLIQLEDYVNNIPNSKMVLVSFSQISELMKQKLRELNIKTFINPDDGAILSYLKD